MNKTVITRTKYSQYYW